MPHSWIAEHRLTWKLHTLRLVLIMLEGAHAHYVRREMMTNLAQLWTLPAAAMADRKRGTHWYSSGRALLGVTSHFVIGTKAHSRSWNPCWHRAKSLLIGRSYALGKSPIALFCQMEIALKWLIAVLKAFLNLLQRSLLLYQMAINTKMLIQPMCTK